MSSRTSIETSVTIAADPDAVWAIVRDVERWPAWTASVTEVRRLDAGPFAVGSRVRIRQPRFPPALWTVTALDEAARSFTWVSRGPGLQVTGFHRVEPAATGSVATLGIEFAGLLGSLWARATGGITERYVGLEAQGLKRRSEAAAGEAAAGKATDTER